MVDASTVCTTNWRTEHDIDGGKNMSVDPEGTYGLCALCIATDRRLPGVR
jgi:hypothetical protein